MGGYCTIDRMRAPRGTPLTPAHHPGMYPSEPFPHFVDDYLAYLHEALPSYAGLDGVHAHDDLLEDLSRQAIDAHVRTLSGFGRRLHQIDPTHLSGVERVDHPHRGGHIEARMYELEVVRTWERNPQMYADIIGSSLAGQALFAYAPEAERARRVVSKLRQVPRVVQAARDNIKECPGIFVKVGLESWRGALTFIESDLPRRSPVSTTSTSSATWPTPSTEAATAIPSYIDYLETDLAPRAKASFRLGRERFERKLKLDEGIDVSADRLLAIALRELHEVQEEFRKVAEPLERRRSDRSVAEAKEQHPAPGKLIAAAQAQVEELEEFLAAAGDRDACPTSEPVVVAPSPDFYRWAFASMWTPGPFESKPSRAYYYLTDVDRSWSPERQKEHLRDFNIPTLWNISIHEVYPGHFLHFQHLRQVESKVRKSTLFAPASFVEGWAHYCEQMMVEAGFRRATPPSARPARRSAGAPRPIRRRHPPALRGSLGRAGHALLPRRGVPRRGHRAA